MQTVLNVKEKIRDTNALHKKTEDELRMRKIRLENELRKDSPSRTELKAIQSKIEDLEADLKMTPRILENLEKMLEEARTGEKRKTEAFDAAVKNIPSLGEMQKKSKQLQSYLEAAQRLNKEILDWHRMRGQIKASMGRTVGSVNVTIGFNILKTLTEICQTENGGGVRHIRYWTPFLTHPTTRDFKAGTRRFPL